MQLGHAHHRHSGFACTIHHRLSFLIGALALTLLAHTASASFAFQDPVFEFPTDGHYTDPTNKVLDKKDLDPVLQNGNWVWPQAWTNNGASPNDVVVGVGEHIYLGLNNEEDKKKIKQVTITFTVTGDYPGTPRFTKPPQRGKDVNWGYSNGQGGAVAIIDQEFNNNSFYKLVVEIGPQPAWEWFRICNTHKVNPMTITDFKMKSVCYSIPAPGSLALLGLSGVFCRRSRPRAT